jgi:hypothetical protein
MRRGFRVRRTATVKTELLAAAKAAAADAGKAATTEATSAEAATQAASETAETAKATAAEPTAAESPEATAAESAKAAATQPTAQPAKAALTANEAAPLLLPGLSARHRPAGERRDALPWKVRRSAWEAHLRRGRLRQGTQPRGDARDRSAKKTAIPGPRSLRLRCLTT